MESNGLNAWEYFYQIVSYKLKSRLDDKEALINMIYKCRKKGIRIYSQVVINQMIFLGKDIYDGHYDLNELTVSYLNPNWFGKISTAGSPYFPYFGRKYVNYYSNKPPIF